MQDRRLWLGELYEMVMNATDNALPLRKPQWFGSVHEAKEKKKSYSFKRILSGFGTRPKQS